MKKMTVYCELRILGSI